MGQTKYEKKEIIQGNLSHKGDAKAQQIRQVTQ
jgi:hypothetical protein